MKQYMKLLIGVAALVVILGGSYVLYNYLTKEYGDKPNQIVQQDASEEPEELRAKAVDFTVLDQNGQEKTLLAFKGRPIILNFWASWCGPCKKEFPELQNAFAQYGDNVAFFMVNMTDGGRETVETATQFIESQGYTFPIYYDTTGEAADTYAVFSIPTTYFIDRDGYIVTTIQGAMDETTLQNAITMIQ